VQNGMVYLTKNTISKQKKFNFKNIKTLTIRLYPFDLNTITNFKIIDINILKKRKL
jgi:hypothetical protein